MELSFQFAFFLHDLKLFFPFLLPHTLRFYKFVCVVEISFKTCFFSVEVNPSICFHHPPLLFSADSCYFFCEQNCKEGTKRASGLGSIFFCESVTLFFCCCLLTYSVQHHFVKKRNYNLFCSITTPLLLKDFSSTMTGKKKWTSFWFSRGENIKFPSKKVVLNNTPLPPF